MFKAVLTFFRGRVTPADADLEERPAPAVLDRQTREAVDALNRSRQTLGLAIAGHRQEGRRLETTRTRIAALEVRAIAALESGRHDLAREAAYAIANLEAERDAATAARSLFASEIARLQRHVGHTGVGLNGTEAAGPDDATLPDAERAQGFGRRMKSTAADVLARLRARCLPAA